MNTSSQFQRILCFGDSLTFGKIPGETKRFPPDERWTGVLQEMLGEGYEIIEEGLRGRTTDLDDPASVGRNGLTYFQSAILSHLPVDLVIVLLGTNDLKEKFNRTPSEIASVFKKYKEAIVYAATYLEEKEPRILLIAPPLVDEAKSLPEWGYAGATLKSQEFAKEYEAVAKTIGADFLDLSSLVTPDSLDGVHLDVASNKQVASAIYAKIMEGNK